MKSKMNVVSIERKKQNERRVCSQKRMVVENDEIELKQTNVMLSAAKEEMKYL